MAISTRGQAHAAEIAAPAALLSTAWKASQVEGVFKIRGVNAGGCCIGTAANKLLACGCVSNLALRRKCVSGSACSLKHEIRKSIRKELGSNRPSSNQMPYKSNREINHKEARQQQINF